jgi:hypothetical protein
MNQTWAERMADGSVDSVDKGSGRQIVPLGVGSAALGGRALTLTEPRATLGSGEMSEEEFLPRFPSTLTGGLVLFFIYLIFLGRSKARVKSYKYQLKILQINTVPTQDYFCSMAYILW